MVLWKRLCRGRFFRRVLTLLCISVPAFGILVLLSPGFPDAPSSLGQVAKSETGLSETKLGDLALSMIAMLPDDLAFTVFAPSDEAFERVLKLRPSISLMTDKMNNTIAILSRVMGFCAVPLHLPSKSVPVLEELALDSVSGLRISVWKTPGGTLFANNVSSDWVDLRKGEVIVHVMGGVIMDAEFELSFAPDYEE
ncbi:hypothetical protein KSP40_PGU013521 [Platanthera guangdongensis]|uniref:FAS1 domain-containing protein n=2 Tax=Platanthera guangdongensis TaxID=2320717 RepID=A0ABR2MWX0_9ASPA